jgi:hypothetical protein
MDLRRVLLISDTILAEGTRAADRPVRRVAACSVVGRPHLQGEDLEPLINLGEVLGHTLAQEALAVLGVPAAASYGKASIIDLEGEVEHAAAVLHPKMGGPIRAAIGGGKAPIPSNAKGAAAGASTDVPSGDKDDPWNFAAIDTITITVPDAPRPDEIVVIVALADGSRPRARIVKTGAPAAASGSST